MTKNIDTTTTYVSIEYNVTNQKKTKKSFTCLNFVPKILFLAQFAPKIKKCFVSNETWHVYVFQGADNEFGKSFSKFWPPVFFLTQFDPKI